MKLLVVVLTVLIAHKHQVSAFVDMTSIPIAIGDAGVETIKQINNALNELAGMAIAIPTMFSDRLGTIVGNIAAEITNFPTAIKIGPLGAIFQGILKFMTTLQDGVMGLLRNGITTATQQATALTKIASDMFLTSAARINATLSTVTAEIDAAIVAAPTKIACLTGLQLNATAAAANAFSGIGSCVNDKINKSLSSLTNLQGIIALTASSLNGSMTALQDCVRKVNAADNIINKITTASCLVPASASLVFGNLAELSTQISKRLTSVTDSVQKLQTDLATCASLNTFNIPSITNSIASC